VSIPTIGLGLGIPRFDPEEVGLFRIMILGTNEDRFARCSSGNMLGGLEEYCS